MLGRGRRTAFSTSCRAMAGPALPATNILPARWRSIRRAAPCACRAIRRRCRRGRSMPVSMRAATFCSPPTTIRATSRSIASTLMARSARRAPRHNKRPPAVFPPLGFPPAPGNRAVILVTRGNHAEAGKPEDPGGLKTYRFENGVLSNLASIAPGNGSGTGLGFGPRHLDFHPTQPWAFVSIERQNKIYVYRLDDATGLAREPMFIKDTL